MRAIIAFLALLAILQPSQAENQKSIPGQFDYYVLSITWLPGYCASQNQRKPASICANSYRTGFVVHGLWPQYEKGWPQFCTAPQKPDRALLGAARNLYQDYRAADYQWRKHGACSGLAPKDYFDLTQEAAGKINLKPLEGQLQRQRYINWRQAGDILRKSNLGLGEGMFRVTAKRGQLQQIRVCLTKDLRYRSCKNSSTDMSL